ncbi:hypothetical protein TrLO_g8689 [Triparma laevis f. longispina]|uniref:Uncharacterized protein n=1 Tax=Triparma laevis f. longispina TaxID=1714387 RepID=A0A9W6ZK36_9STRA|nr:hypothetical protein TrLO_g8689 [Triparma laevis f. longispina]
MQHLFPILPLLIFLICLLTSHSFSPALFVVQKQGWTSRGSTSSSVLSPSKFPLHAEIETKEPPAAVNVEDVECEVPEELSESKKLLQKVKDAGIAGGISYAAWELGFWGVSVPVCVFGYREVTGHWPDFQNQDDVAKLSAEAFAFVNFARFAVPLRIGLALGTTPWVQKNVVDRFMKKDEVVDPNCVEVGDRD